MMILNKHVYLAVATAAYMVAFVAAFDVLSESVMIPSIALTGLCAWLYGLRTGLLSLIPLTMLNAGLLHFMSAQSYGMMSAYNPVGLIMAMVAAIATGSLKESCDKLARLRSSLAARIDEATAELEKRARLLIEKDEYERIQIGQALHDGVGQYLTGMLLHSGALSVSLKEAGRSEAELAERMEQRVEKSIQTVRQLARSLLPIQFSETNLETALEEMVSYFSEYSKAAIHLICHGSTGDIPIPTAQHLYRIIHETLYRSICTYHATDVDITLITKRGCCQSLIKGTTPAGYKHPNPDLVSEIMKYRIGAIGAHHAFTAFAEGGFRLECAADFEGVHGC